MGTDIGLIIFLDLLSSDVQILYARYGLLTKPITLIQQVGENFVCISKEEYLSLFGFNEQGRPLVYVAEVNLGKSVRLLHRVSEIRFLVIYGSGDSALFEIRERKLYLVKCETQFEHEKAVL